jgi:predicted DNA binding protein
MFNDPILKIIGFIIAGIEAVSAIIGLVKKVFPNNKKVNDVADVFLNALESLKSSLQNQQKAIIEAKPKETLTESKPLTPNQAQALKRAQERTEGAENVS